MANALQRSVSATGAALRRRYQETFSEPAALRRIWRRAQAGAVPHDLPDNGFGSYEAGAELASGVFRFAGQSVSAAPSTIWRAAAPTPAWRAALHGFEWLEHLSAVGNETAREAGRAAVASWIEAHGGFDPLVWSADVTARRLLSWIIFFDVIAGDAAFETKARTAIWAQAEWMRRAYEQAAPGLDRLRAAVALATSAAAIEGLSGRRGDAIFALEDAVALGLADDGAMIGRRPSDSFEALALLRLLSIHLDVLDLTAPDSLNAALAELGRVARFFRSADGGLPCLQGSSELSDGRLDSVLAPMRGLPSAPKRLTTSGFERLSGGRAVVFVDVGPAPGAPFAHRGHASALAIEVQTGRRRLIVSSGPPPAGRADVRLAFRSEAAHSLLTVNDTPFAARQTSAREGDPDISGPKVTTVERKEERSGSWLLATHVGYVARFGLTQSRRLFLSADGGDFRGEDTLSVETAADEASLNRALQRLPRGRRDRGLPFAARFLLHPDVSATMVADGEAATLRLPHGEVWVMRQAGGQLALEDAVYTGRGETPERTKQIVVRGAARRNLTQVRWAFRRVGELSQLPRDLQALGVSLDEALSE